MRSDDAGERTAWSRRLVTAGWLFLIAYLGFVVSKIRRASSITQSSFEDGVWGQRIETLSFVVIPQNAIILVPTAAAVVAVTLLIGGRPEHDPRPVRQLSRVLAGVSYVLVLLGVIGIVGIFFRTADSTADLEALLSRAGGIAMAIAVIGLCAESDRRA